MGVKIDGLDNFDIMSISIRFQIKLLFLIVNIKQADNTLRDA